MTNIKLRNQQLVKLEQKYLYKKDAHGIYQEKNISNKLANNVMQQVCDIEKQYSHQNHIPDDVAFMDALYHFSVDTKKNWLMTITDMAGSDSDYATVGIQSCHIMSKKNDGIKWLFHINNQFRPIESDSIIKIIRYLIGYSVNEKMVYNY